MVRLRLPEGLHTPTSSFNKVRPSAVLHLVTHRFLSGLPIKLRQLDFLRCKRGHMAYYSTGPRDHLTNMFNGVQGLQEAYPGQVGHFPTQLVHRTRPVPPVIAMPNNPHFAPNELSNEPPSRPLYIRMVGATPGTRQRLERTVAKQRQCYGIRCFLSVLMLK